MINLKSHLSYINQRAARPKTQQMFPNKKRLYAQVFTSNLEIDIIHPFLKVYRSEILKYNSFLNPRVHSTKLLKYYEILKQNNAYK